MTKYSFNMYNFKQFLIFKKLNIDFTLFMKVLLTYFFSFLINIVTSVLNQSKLSLITMNFKEN